MRWEFVPAGEVGDPQAGDFILTHRNGVLPFMIRIGQWLRTSSWSSWSHAAFCVNKTQLYEALWNGVRLTSIERYRPTPFIIVRTSEGDLKEKTDYLQALNYVKAQRGKAYGYVTLLGAAMRFLLPGHDFFFRSRGDICSGLVAQALTRGDALFDFDPGSLAPIELAEHYSCPTNPHLASLSIANS